MGISRRDFVEYGILVAAIGGIGFITGAMAYFHNKSVKLEKRVFQLESEKAKVEQDYITLSNLHFQASAPTNPVSQYPKRMLEGAVEAARYAEGRNAQQVRPR